MTVKEIKDKIKDIKTQDNETAHILEDALYQAVLEEIAKGTPNAQELAKEVLKTKKLNFHRWYA